MYLEKLAMLLTLTSQASKCKQMSCYFITLMLLINLNDIYIPICYVLNYNCLMYYIIIINVLNNVIMNKYNEGLSIIVTNRL